MSLNNLDAADLAAALAAPGLIAEDVVDAVRNLDEGIPQPFTNAVGSSTIDALYTEWTENDLNDPDPNNAFVDGADASGNDVKVGLRIGNRAQGSDKVVRISHAAEAVDSFGSVGRLAYQTARRLMDLRRDVEAILTGRQGSQVDDGNATPGKTGALGAFIKTHTDFGIGGSAGGFNTATKVVEAPVAGTPRALAWENVRDVLEGIYTGGGNPSVLMSVPGVIKRINSFLFSDAGKPYRADPTANVQGTSPATQTAQGYISVVLSDFGITMRLIDNRLQQLYDGAADVFLLDPAHAEIGYLYGYRSDELGKGGHSYNRLLSVVYALKVLREDAHGMIADVDPTAAVTAT